MAGIPGVVDLSVEQQTDVPVLAARLDRDALARHGITVAQAARSAARPRVGGLTVSRVLEGRNSFDLVLRVAGDGGVEPARLSRLCPSTRRAGRRIPLGAVARIAKDMGPNLHLPGERGEEDRRPVQRRRARCASVVADAQRLGDPIVAGERGHRVEYGGQFEAAASASRLLGILGILVVLGIGFLLHLAFGSARDSCLVMVNLPLALIGGIAGSLRVGRRPLRGVHHRLHHGLRDRGPERDHARLAHSDTSRRRRA